MARTHEVHGHTRAASRLALLALLAAAWWFLAPPALGGSTTYVVTGQQSGMPDYPPGGLALVRPDSDYSLGDVVAHLNGPDGTVTLDRIVAADGDRFVVRGDTSRQADGYRPTGEEVLGTPWLYVPGKDALASAGAKQLAVGLGLLLLACLLLVMAAGTGRPSGPAPVNRPRTRLQS